MSSGIFGSFFGGKKDKPESLSKTSTSETTSGNTPDVQRDELSPLPNPQVGELSPVASKSALKAATTQPMVLPKGGLQPAKKPSMIFKGKSTQRITLPGRADTALSQPSTAAEISGELSIPIVSIARLLPQEVLAMPLQEFEASPESKQEIQLPLQFIIPQLESGKIELSIEQILPHFPSNILQPQEQIQSYLSSIIVLPLMDVVTRIPPNMLSLRPDQKKVDTDVVNMADPFTEEILREQAEKARKEAEQQRLAETVQSVPEPPPPSSFQIPTASIPMSSPPTSPSSPSSPVANIGAGAPLLPIPSFSQPQPEASSQKVPDFQSEEMRRLAEQAEAAFKKSPTQPSELKSLSTPTSEAPKPPLPNPLAPAPPPPPSIGIGSPSKPSLNPVPSLAATPVAPLPRSFSPPSPSKPSVSQGDASGAVPPPSGAPSSMASGISFTPPSAIPPLPPKPTEVPLGAKAQASSPLPSASFAQSSTSTPPAAPASSPSSQEGINLATCSVEDLVHNFSCPPTLASAIVLYREKSGGFHSLEELLNVPGLHAGYYFMLTGQEPTLNSLLGFPSDREISLKEILERILHWPGIIGCFLTQDTGLFLAGQVASGTNRDAIVGHLPKMCESLNKSFCEFSGEEVDVMVFSQKGGVIFTIFSYHNLFLVIQSLCWIADKDFMEDLSWILPKIDAHGLK